MRGATLGMMAWLLAAGVAGAEGPRTPETRTLTAEEASQAMEQDWLFQAMGEPLAERAAKEIDWARQLAERLSRGHAGPRSVGRTDGAGRPEQRLKEIDRPSGNDPATQGRAHARQPGSGIPRASRRKTRPPRHGSSAAGSRLPAERPRRPSCASRPTTPARSFVNGTRVGAQETWQRRGGLRGRETAQAGPQRAGRPRGEQAGPAARTPPD